MTVNGWRVAVVAFAGWLALSAFVYYRTPSTFLRCESGWYELIAKSKSVTRNDFIRKIFTCSYNGHYTPLAFFGEFELSDCIGPNGFFWKWRQVAAVAALATAVTIAVLSLARALRVRPHSAVIAAFGISAICVYQPLMRELVAWPFMVMQLIWMGMYAAIVALLVRLIQDPQDSRRLWWLVVAAYATLHVLGLGLVAAAAVSLFLLGLYLLCRAGRLPRFEGCQRTILCGLLVLWAISAIHGACMVLLLHPEHQPSTPAGVRVTDELGFIATFFLAVVRSVFEPGAEAYRVLPPLAAAAPAGVLLILAAAMLIGRTAAQTWRAPDEERLVRSAVQLLTIVSFFGSLAMMVVRRAVDPVQANPFGMLTASRYLVPAATMLVIGAAPGALLLMRAWPRSGMALLLAAGLQATVAQRWTVPRAFAQVHPLSTMSHEAAWTAILKMAEQARAAHLPIPNVPLATLTQEFDSWDLQLFEPLVRAELKTPRDEALAFMPWEKATRERYTDYAGAVPALQEVAKRIAKPQPRER